MNSNEINLTAGIILIGVIVLINLALWLAVIRKDSFPEMQKLMKSTRTLSQSWDKEEAEMRELSERVAALRDRVGDSEMDRTP